MTLDELERRFIRAAQRELVPSAADRGRNEAQLLERLGPASPWGPAGSGLGLSRRGARSLGSGAVAGALRSALGSRLGMLGAGLVVGAVVGGWFGFGLGRSGVSSPPAAPGADAPFMMPAPGPAGPEPIRGAPLVPLPDALLPETLPPETLLSETPGLEPPGLEPPGVEPFGASAVPEGEAAPAGADGARQRAASARPKGPRRPSAAAPFESSLSVEIAMLQRARRALNDENGRLALGIVLELDERFPKGVLVEERNATRILSLCQLERVGEAQRAAREFLDRYPASVYAERVRESCVAGPSR